MLRPKIVKNLLPESNRAERLAAFIVVMGLAVFEFVYAKAGFFASVGRLEFANDPVSGVFSGALLLLTFWLFYRFILLAFVSNTKCRVAVFLVLASLLVVEFSYLRSIGRFTTTADITYAITATSDQRAYTFATFVSFAWLPVIAIVVGVSIYFAVTRKRNVGSGGFLRDAAIFGVTYAAVPFLAPLLGGQSLYSSSFDAFAQTAVNYAISGPVAVAAPPKRKSLVRVAQANTLPANNIILIFDESVNGRHLSLNGYARKTTPYLDELEKHGILKNFGVAASTFTSSHPSYDAFIVGATDEMLDSISLQERNTLPSIFQFAKSMNYKTWYLDGQMKTYWGGIEDDLRYIDELFTIADIDPDRIEDYQKNNGRTMTDENKRDGLKQWDIDLLLAEKIKSIFEGSTGNFVFVYKRGIHFPYEKNYPEENTVWQPIYKFTSQWETPPPEAHDGITNSYDNALLFGTDAFFRKLDLDRPLPNGTVIVYTSDHGENFAANGRAGHGGDTIDEASIPLFIIGLDRSPAGAISNAHHSNIFPTLLDLMNFPMEARTTKYAPSLFDPAMDTARPRYYHSGDGRRFLFEN